MLYILLLGLMTIFLYCMEKHEKYIFFVQYNTLLVCHPSDPTGEE